MYHEEVIRINYGALVFRIKEFGLTQAEVAQKIGTTPTSFSLKINNRVQFQQNEILKIAELLELDMSEIGFYFFTRSVKKAQT